MSECGCHAQATSDMLGALAMGGLIMLSGWLCGFAVLKFLPSCPYDPSTAVT